MMNVITTNETLANADQVDYIAVHYFALSSPLGQLDKKRVGMLDKRQLDFGTGPNGIL